MEQNKKIQSHVSTETQISELFLITKDIDMVIQKEFPKITA